MFTFNVVLCFFIDGGGGDAAHAEYSNIAKCHTRTRCMIKDWRWENKDGNGKSLR